MSTELGEPRLRMRIAQEEIFGLSGRQGGTEGFEHYLETKAIALPLR